MKENLNKKTKKKIWPNRMLFVVLFLAFAFSVLCYGYYLGQKGTSFWFFPRGITNTETGKPAGADFSIYWEAWNKFKEKSVSDPDSQKMIYGSISGMLSSIGDPYTEFFTPEENQRFRQDIEGTFNGIGVELTWKDDMPTVVAPLSDTPAEKAGLKPNDIIIEIDGVSTENMNLDQVIDKIRGDLDTAVILKVYREGQDEPITMSIVRQNIVVKSVRWSVQNQSGKKYFIIKISQFGDDTEALFNQAIQEIVATEPYGIVIDLRNNPGGYLQTAVDLSSRFVPDGVIVSERGRGGTARDYKSIGNATLESYKVAVIINGGSASASEIMAGALRDRRAVKLVGEKTFGKGSVQELIDFSDGSAAKITVAKWYTPSGSQINGEGLTPDIVVTDDAKTAQDDQLMAAFGVL